MASNRLNRLSTSLQSAGLDVLALNPGPSLTYLTGLQFHLMERPIVGLFRRDAPPVLVLPELEVTKAQSVPGVAAGTGAAGNPIQTFAYGENPASWGEAFVSAAKALDLDGKTIGVEPTHLRYLELRLLEEATAGSRFVSAAETLSSLRIQKDAEEIALIRQAVNIAQRAFNATLPLIKIGMTERQLASELTAQLLRAGSDPQLPFSPIIASGPNSANPHATSSDRPLQAGDLVVIDWGATLKGYCSDLTRTIAVKEVRPELAYIAEVVALANATGRAAGKPGVPAGQVDRATREVIEENDYGEYFTHRTGHGLGMEEHEDPYLYGENPLPLAPGMVYTVEPGIYIPNLGGVRIEDDVLVTPGGSESLSNLVRDLIVVG